MAHHKLLQQLGIFTIPQFLTPEECAQWRSLAATTEGTPAKVYKGDESLVDDEHRKTLMFSVEDSLRTELEQRLTGLRSRLEEAFGVSLGRVEKIGCLMYRAGDFFRLHADVPSEATVSAAFPFLHQRRVTILISLNEPGHDVEPYEGGVLSLFGLMQGPASQNFGFPVDVETGLLIAFPATMLHEVSPVTAGNRYTLVTWFLATEPQENQDAPHPKVQAEAPGND